MHCSYYYIASRYDFLRRSLNANITFMVFQAPSARSRGGSPDLPRQHLGKEGLAFFTELLAGSLAGWVIERAAFTLRELSFSLVKGPRRLEFSVSPDVRRGLPGGPARRACRLLPRNPPDDLSAEEREVSRTITAGLAGTSFVTLITRLLRDGLLYSDPEGNRIPSRLDRYYRINDHSQDFWKFVYPQWCCLEEKVILGAHWTRINYATLECRLSNPNPEVPSLRYFADDSPGRGKAEYVNVDPIITEADVLGGRTQAKLGRELDRVARAQKPVFIHLNTTCMPELLGDTPIPFIKRIEGDLGVPVFWTSKTRPGGPLYAKWIGRLLDKIKFSRKRDPRAVLLAGIPTASAQAEAVELCAGIGLRVVGILFPNLDFRRTPEMGAASAVIWLNPLGWETIGDETFLRHGLTVVRYHPPYVLAGTQAWLARIAAVLGIKGAEKSCARARKAISPGLAALRKESSLRTVALIGDLSDLKLLTTEGRALGFSLAALLGELGFNVRCLLYDGGAQLGRGARRRVRVPMGANAIEFVPFSSRAQLDRRLARGVDLAFSHLSHDQRLGAHGLLGFTEDSFEVGFDGLLRSGRRLLAKCAARPFPRHRSCLSPWTP